MLLWREVKWCCADPRTYETYEFLMINCTSCLCYNEKFLLILLHRSSRRNLSSTPQGDATFPLRTKSQPVAISTPTPTGTGSPISSPSQMKKQLAYARTKPSPPTVLAKPAKSSTSTKQREGREGTRSHASSVTKLRKHRSNQRSKEAPANLTPKIWRSAPRMVSTCTHTFCC